MTERLLTVAADLTIDVADRKVRVRGRGRSIVVEIPSLALLFVMTRDLGNPISVSRRISRIAQTLSALGLTVIVRTPGRRLFTIGREGNSWLLRLFGILNARMHLS